MGNRWSTGIQHHPKRKEFQCKHIPDDLFVKAVLLTRGVRGYEPSDWRLRWNVEEKLRELLGDTAPVGLAKVMMAKFNKLERRGILHGCYCGCRGDYHIPVEKPCC